VAIKLDDYRPYHSNQTTNVLNIPETYTTVNAFSETLPTGIYQVVVSVSWQMDDINDSAFFRLVGDVVSNEFAQEAKDTSDVRAFTYTGELTVNADGVFSTTLEMRKEDAGAGQLDALYSIISFQKVMDA